MTETYDLPEGDEGSEVQAVPVLVTERERGQQTVAEALERTRQALRDARAERELLAARIRLLVADEELLRRAHAVFTAPPRGQT